MHLRPIDHTEFKEKSSPIILLAVEFRQDGYAYARIPLREGFFCYTRICKSSRIADILRNSNAFLQREVLNDFKELIDKEADARRKK